MEIDLASVDTGSDRRDKHLRTDDFFDVERFPTATARIYQIEKGKSGAGLYTSKLDLDLHGFQKTYALVFEVVEGENLEVRGNIYSDLNISEGDTVQIPESVLNR